MKRRFWESSYRKRNKTGGRTIYTDGPRIHQHLKELVGDTGIADMMTVGEMSSTSLDNCLRYANPIEEELKMVFSFHHLKVDYKGGEKWALMDPDFKALRDLFCKWQEGMQNGGAWNALFWCNHDQPRAVSRFGDDKKYWKESAKMLSVLIHLMRGTPYIYQGEEIGMTNAGYTSIDQYGDVENTNYFAILCGEGKSPEEALHIIGERSRDNGRTPMQWDDSEFAGFTTGTPWLGIPANHTYINVASEELVEVVRDDKQRDREDQPVEEAALSIVPNCRKSVDKLPPGRYYYIIWKRLRQR